MEFQRMKLESVKERITRGDRVRSTAVENGEYIVRFSHGPDVTFDDNYRATVDETIDKANRGVRENNTENSTTMTEAKSPR